MNIYLVKSGLDISNKNSIEKTGCSLGQDRKATACVTASYHTYVSLPHTTLD